MKANVLFVGSAVRNNEEDSTIHTPVAIENFCALACCDFLKEHYLQMSVILISAES